MNSRDCCHNVPIGNIMIFKWIMITLNRSLCLKSEILILSFRRDPSHSLRTGSVTEKSCSYDSERFLADARNDKLIHYRGIRMKNLLGTLLILLVMLFTTQLQADNSTWDIS